MKKITALVILLLFSKYIYCQNKPVIDTGMLGTWPQISPNEGSIALSTDGHYVAYIIYNQPIGKNSLVLHDLRGNWKKTLLGSNIRILFFSKDGRHLCWQQGDSIWLQKTGDDENHLLGVTNTLSYPIDSKGEWVLIPSRESDTTLKLVNIVAGKEQTITSVKTYSWLTGERKLLVSTVNGDLNILNLENGKKQSFTNIKDYSISPDSKSILLLTEKDDTGKYTSLQYANLNGGYPITIWRGTTGQQPGSYLFDKTGKQLAFTVRSTDGSMSVWHYNTEQVSATLKIEDKSIGLNANMQISDITAFSDNGRWLFFNIRKKLPLLPNEPVVAPVDIWSYKDEVLNPAQTNEIKSFHDHQAVLNIPSNKAKIIEIQDDERIEICSISDYVILHKGGHGSNVGSWWPYCEPYSLWLLSLEDGHRQQIKQLNVDETRIHCSPQGRWILLWDEKVQKFFSMKLEAGGLLSPSWELPSLAEDDNIEGKVQIGSVGIAGWYEGDSALLVYDNYDIWKLDPSCKKPPINITGGYGRRNGVKLRLISETNNHYKGDEELLLSGFDVETKWDGFFIVRLNKPGQPKLLTMGPYSWYQTAMMKHSFSAGMRPLLGGRGKDKRWVVMRQSAIDYPNLFVTKDLKNFTPLTNLQPQRIYNWLQTELVRWKMYNGQTSYGILYKPENFDSTKKYPIIFNYYEQYSHRCYQFPMPGLTTENINIPWFVSRGYLVFTPDIQYTIANKAGGMTIGEAAYNAVASAAEWLSRRSYIDKTRMAIQGHSFGGLETNSIITHTNMFAAAAEMAGTADILSSYLTLVTANEDENAVENTHKQDHPQGRMGATPWERPDLYRRNSPVLNADKVSTPLFIVHNKRDGSINFRQGVEMYMALRRLGKPCWLLQYDHSGHSLYNRQDAVDYTIRLTQYFDHYLKGAPAPQWMTLNMLAGYKGKNNLYTPDPAGYCNKDCIVCQEWNKKKKEENK